VSTRKIIIGLLVTVVILTLLWVYRAPLISASRWFTDLDAEVKTIRSYGFWGPAVLFILFILQTFIAFIPGQALSMAGGYLYGFATGIIISWTSAVLSSQCVFWLVRRYGRPFAERWVTPPTLDRWDKIAANQGIAFYVVTLVMPFFPNDAMCYVAGLGNISFRRFLVANIVGRGIASILTVIVGAYGAQMPILIVIFIVGFIILGIVGWIVARRFSKKYPGTS